MDFPEDLEEGGLIEKRNQPEAKTIRDEEK